MTQQQKQRQPSTAEQTEPEDVEAKDLHNEELAEETDDLLDEIDGVLEENAQEFVDGFVQKGGE